MNNIQVKLEEEDSEKNTQKTCASSSQLQNLFRRSKIQAIDIPRPVPQYDHIWILGDHPCVVKNGVMQSCFSHLNLTYSVQDVMVQKNYKEKYSLIRTQIQRKFKSDYSQWPYLKQWLMGQKGTYAQRLMQLNDTCLVKYATFQQEILKDVQKMAKKFEQQSNLYKKKMVSFFKQYPTICLKNRFFPPNYDLGLTEIVYNEKLAELQGVSRNELISKIFQTGIQPFLKPSTLEDQIQGSDVVLQNFCNPKFDSFCKSPVFRSEINTKSGPKKIQLKEYIMEAFDEDGSFGYDIVFPIICVNDLPLSESTSASDSEESGLQYPELYLQFQEQQKKDKEYMLNQYYRKQRSDYSTSNSQPTPQSETQAQN